MKRSLIGREHRLPRGMARIVQTVGIAAGVSLGAILTVLALVQTAR